VDWAGFTFPILQCIAYLYEKRGNPDANKEWIAYLYEKRGNPDANKEWIAYLYEKRGNPDANKECIAYLYEKRGNPDANKEWIAVESVEDVSLSVNLASVDLVKQCHHDERVEDDGEVLTGALRLRW